MENPERSLVIGLFEKSFDERKITGILDEVISLIETAGGVYSGSITQKGRGPDRSFFIGKGKVEEIECYLSENDIDIIISANTLSGVQQRNLEERLKKKVIDRTRLILDIFAQRARTLEGKLQVELAQLLYLMPRLTGKGLELSRLGGGIGTRGPGETKLESDRRVIKKKISVIGKKLDKVKRNRAVQRKNRKESPVPLVSLAGYTSAGKSTLFNLLTEESVPVTKMLFSTLDTLVRRVDLKEYGEGYYFLLSDTVGFIRDMPRELLKSFYATLEEITESDIILHVSDISKSDHKDRESDVQKVLSGMGIPEEKIIRVLNKIDKIERKELISGDGKDRSNREVLISAKFDLGIKELKKFIFDRFFRGYERFSFLISKKSDKIQSINKWSIVLKKIYVNDYIHIEVLSKKEKMLKFLDENKGDIK